MLVGHVEIGGDLWVGFLGDGGSLIGAFERSNFHDDKGQGEYAGEEGESHEGYAEALKPYGIFQIIHFLRHLGKMRHNINGVSSFFYLYSKVLMMKSIPVVITNAKIIQVKVRESLTSFPRLMASALT